jgi:hypothetical protein
MKQMEVESEITKGRLRYALLNPLVNILRCGIDESVLEADVLREA